MALVPSAVYAASLVPCRFQLPRGDVPALQRHLTANGRRPQRLPRARQQLGNFGLARQATPPVATGIM